MAEKGFNFDKILDNLKKMKEDLPVQIANDAQRFFVKTFNQQGFTDDIQQPWKEVERRIPGTRAYKYPKKRRLGRRTSAILVKTGTLRRAVNNSVRETKWDRIRFSVEVPYGRYHNEGGPHLPKRKFIGASRTLNAQLKKRIEKAFIACFKT